MRKKTCFFAAVLMTGMLLLSGCNENEKHVFEQAGKDLDQEYYEYALEGYRDVIASGILLPQSYRGAGIAYLRMGKYDNAITSFTNALAQPKVSKALRKDLLSYRATAYLKSKKNYKALADCETLAEEYDMDANSYFLTGMVSLEMDSYDQARANFDRAFLASPTYDMGIRIYQVYLEKGMEADGTKYLEAALENEASTPEEYLDRGKVYFYMEDNESARQELITAANMNNTEALLLLGMVYMEQKDYSNSRSMYQEYIAKVGSSAKGYNGLAQCDIHEKKFAEALEKIRKGKEIASTEEYKDLLYNEMIVYEEQMDFQTARARAEEYLSLFPGDANVKRELVFLKSRTDYAIPYEEPPAETTENSEEDYNSYDEESYDSDYDSDYEEYYDYDSDDDY